MLGDADELKAAVWNLIDNAVKYSPAEIRISMLRSRRLRSRIGCAVRVTDRGVGISPTELKRIFRRFYRMPALVAMRAKGSGLGLFIVRSVAKKPRRARVRRERRGRAGQHVHHPAADGRRSGHDDCSDAS